MTSFVTSRARLSILASKSRLNPVGCHIKFIEAEKEALQLYKGHRSCNPHNFQNCFKEILFTGLFIYLFFSREPFCQLNNSLKVRFHFCERFYILHGVTLTAIV